MPELGPIIERPQPSLGPVVAPAEPGAASDAPPETSWTGEAREFFRGVPAGAVEAGGLALRGFAANQPGARLAGYLDEIERGVRYRTREREGRVPVSDERAYTDLLGRIAGDAGLMQHEALWLRDTLERYRAGDETALAEVRARLPGPVRERPAWRAGETVSEFGRTHFPAAEGYEHSLGRVAGEGVGSLLAGVSAAVVPVAGTGLAGGLFMMMGAGEAADRAVAAGASDEQIVEAAGYGLGAGATDLAPVQVLLGRIPLPYVQPATRAVGEAIKRYGGRRVLGALRAGGRVSGQTAVEAVQEAGQEGLQNWIAREVHSPDTRIGEHVPEAGGIGGIVGAIAGLGREGVIALAGRRSASRRGARAAAAEAVPEPSAADEASPIPTETIQEGRRLVAEAQAGLATEATLDAAGLPRIGLPVKITRGRDIAEGVVTDAWGTADDPGIAVTAANGELLVDNTVSEMGALGITVEGLAMPPPLAEIEAAREKERTEAERERASRPTSESRPGTDAEPPRLDRVQMAEVARLVGAGVEPMEAVRRASMPGAPREPSAGPPSRPVVVGPGGRPDDAGPPRRGPVLGPLAKPTRRGPQTRPRAEGTPERPLQPEREGGRVSVTMQALPRLPRVPEIAEAAQEEGIPPETAAQVGEQVYDALATPQHAPPTVDMLQREIAATGLPVGFAERIALLVAERQGMAEAARARAEGMRDEAPPAPEVRTIPEREAPERPSVRTLPEGFTERMADAVASIPEVQRLSEGTRRRLAEAVAERIEPPDIEAVQADPPRGLPEDFGERLRAVPGVSRIPVSQRDEFERKVAEAAAQAAAVPELGAPRDTPAPEVRTIPPRTRAGVPPGEAIEAAERETETETETEPSDAQKEAGNYRKGKFTLHGLAISIETPKGAERSGVGADGQRWAVQMPASYGYIRRTEGADGEQVDVYVGPEPEAETVFVVDQVDAETRAFDEHKAMVGYPDEAAAIADYDAAFDDGRGPERRGAITQMSVADFKRWLDEGDTTQPVALPEGEAGAPSQPPAAKPPVERDEGERSAEVMTPPAAPPTRQRAPLDVLQFIARNGGIRDDRGDLGAMNAERVFVPGAGMLVRRGGRSPDEVGEALHEEGYFGPPETTERPTVREVLDLIDESIRGQRRYSAQDEADVAAREAEAERREDAARLREAMDEVQAAAGERGLALPSALQTAVAERRLAGENVDDALDDVLEREALAYEQDPATERDPAEFPALEIAGEAGAEGIAEAGPEPGAAPVRAEPGDDAGAEGEAPAERPDKARLIPTRTPEGGVAIRTEPVVEERPALESLRDYTEAIGNLRGAEHSDELLQAVADEMGAPSWRAIPPERRQEYIDTVRARAAQTPTTERPESDAGAEQLAGWVADRLGEGRVTTNIDLFQEATAAYGGKRSEGAWTPADAYDAAEAGVVEHIQRTPTLRLAPGTEEPVSRINEIQRTVIEKLPTPSSRTKEKQQFQQFSTPPHYALAAVWAANIREGDTVLEPSAGTGMLAVQAVGAAGAENVYLNELAPRRADTLRRLFPGATVFTEDALQLNNIVPVERLDPSVVVMNPPFSRTAGRTATRDVTTGAKHIERALERLRDGGRLVAIVGGGMKPDAPSWKKWWDRIGSEYNVRANVAVGRDVYRKMGTQFPTRLLVIDKTGPTTAPPVVGEAETIPNLVAALRDVRNDRKAAAEPRGRVQPQPAQPGVREAPQAGGRAAGARSRDERPATGGMVGGRPGERVDTGAEPGTRPVRPDAPVAPAQPDEAAERAGDRARAPVEGEDAGGRGRDAGLGDVQRAGPAVPVAPAERDADRAVEVEPEALPEDAPAEIVGGNFAKYQPARRPRGAVKHPTPLVQSAAMAAVDLPATDYRPSLPKETVAKGELSDAQIEAVTYAGAAHERTVLDYAGNEARQALFIGDGTGVGKGREIAGIILDNWEKGRTKAVWVSKNAPLFEDAQRDMEGVGGNPEWVFPIGKTKVENELKPAQGVAFITYDQLRRNIASFVMNEDGEITSPEATRIGQLRDWLGRDFDGVIAFDESHRMGNAADTKGKRGVKKASQVALAGIWFQRAFPQARIVYVSATGATEVSNLAYAERLGLWGADRQFPDRDSFIADISAGGLAAMEIVARDMKAQGRYIARSLSYEGVEFNRLEHKLTPEQRGVYDEMARAWRIVLDNIIEAMEETEQASNSQRVSAVRAQFYGTLQRFFNILMTSLQMPSVFSAIEADIARGDAVLIQLTNTNQAQQERSLAQLGEDELEMVDTSPRQSLLEYLENTFPVNQYEEYTDDDGNKRSRPVLDSEGKQVQNAAAVAKRDALLRRLAALPVPEGALDLLIKHFGPDKVAEVTGRTRRVVLKEDETGAMVPKLENRGAKAAQKEAAAFMDDRKPILVFSEAGGTGRSYHADKSAKNQRKRQHYVVQAGWRADTAMQGLGRSHRSNQAQEPTYHLVTTDLQGQKRFISSIARRLSQLGALTRGQQSAVGQSLFSERDNLEGPLAKDALTRMLDDVVAGNVEGVETASFQAATGIRLVNDEGESLTGQVEMTKFLNRILALPIDYQNTVFTAFETRLEAGIAYAEQAGTMDKGVETVEADSIEKVDDQVARVDEETGAETRYVKLELTDPVKARTWDQLGQTLRALDVKPAFFAESRRGKFWAVVETDQYRTDSRSGAQIRQARLFGQAAGSQFRDAQNLENAQNWTKYQPDDPVAREKWDAAVAASPKTETREEHLLTGVLLPIWNNVPGEHVIVHRLRTDDGEELLGRVIPEPLVDKTLEAVGLSGAGAPQFSASDALARIEDGPVHLPNDWTLKVSTVGGEERIEIVGPDADWMNALEKAGVIVEMIQYRTRFFIPGGPRQETVTARVLRSAGVTPRLQRGEEAAGAPERARIRLSQRYDESAVVRDIRRIGRETFGDRFQVRFAESIEEPGGERAKGAYDPVNRIAYIALRADRRGMEASLYHEGLHYLRQAGAFTDRQWQTLADQAPAWRERYRIDQRYGALPEEFLVEEAVAEALADYATRGKETGFGPTVRAVMNRVLRFFRALAAALQGRGFQTWEDLFEGITRGEARPGDPAPAALDRQMQTAWHGSPHRFDEFSTEVIGTGEGAQVYGWGLYFADKEGVADWYREGVSARTSPTMEELREYFTPGNIVLTSYGDRDRVIAFNEAPDGWRWSVTVERVERQRDGEWVVPRGERQRTHSTPPDMLQMERVLGRKRGAKYRVNLAPKDSEYLRWELPLYQQPKPVRDAVNYIWGWALANEVRLYPSEEASSIYRQLSMSLGSQRRASLALLEEGVKGIKYLDQASRPIKAPGGRARMPLRETFNYVIFDASDVAIEEVLLQRAFGPDPRQGEMFEGEDVLDERGVDRARARDREQQQEMVEDVFGAETVRRTDKLRSKREQEGVEALPLFDDQRLLFQRADEDPKAFDDAASEWAGVDLTGAAETVTRDREAVGKFSEGVKAQLKGSSAITPANVSVQGRMNRKDMNPILRMIAPPLAAAKKFPAVHRVFKLGVELEIDGSIFTQRLWRKWDGIVRALSGDEFGQLNGLLFLGDAEEVVFTDAQLAEFPTTDKVREAYKRARLLLDELGRYTEQHLRAMSMNALKRRALLIRKMAGERGMDVSAFRTLWRTRAEMIQRLRDGKADPEVLGPEIDAINEQLHGTQPPSAEYEGMVEEADGLEARLAQNKVRRRVGYVPHKFFGRWRVYRRTGTDDNGDPIWEHVAGEHGFWPTRMTAVRAAAQIAKKEPKTQFKVSPVEFVFPDAQATQLSDAAYWRFRGNIEKLLGLEGEALQEAVKGTARRRFRRRIAGFRQYRTGVEGYSRDLDRVMRAHIGDVVRYVRMDRLKYEAINMMEREGLSINRSSVQDRPVLAGAVQAWWRDVNGEKQVLEGGADAILTREWVTPIRAGLAAGALTFLATGGIIGAGPISAALGAYVGWRVGRGIAKGGEFPSRAITGAMLSDMSHLKLGAFFNLASALVNTTQTLLNTMPALGPRWTGVGVKRLEKAVRSRLLGKPNADWRTLQRADINPLNTFAEGTRHQFRPESKLSKVSMVFFTTAEGFNRGVAYLGALSKAEAEGKSPGAARRFAREMTTKTQFHYGPANKPELLRNNFLRVPGQFKNFVAQQIAFAFSLNRRQVPLFLLTMALVAGTLGIPGLDVIDGLMDWLFGVSPIVEMKEAALDAAAKGELEGDLMTLVTRGLPGLAGVDLASRVGMGDKFLPLQVRDWKGAWFSTVETAARHGREGATIADMVRTFSPGLGNPLKALEVWQSGGMTTNPWKRGRPEYRMEPHEILLKGVGLRPIREARMGDIRDVERYDIAGGRDERRRYIDRIVDAQRRGDRREARRLLAEARRSGVRITAQMLRSASQAMRQDRSTRSLRQLPKDMRPQGARWREAVEAR